MNKDGEVRVFTGFGYIASLSTMAYFRVRSVDKRSMLVFQFGEVVQNFLT